VVSCAMRCGVGAVQTHRGPLVGILSLMLCRTLILGGVSTETKYDDYVVMAAMIQKFTPYIEWPTNAFPAPNSPFVIGILGSNPFGEALERIKKTGSIKNRSLVVTNYSSLQEAKGCHILFISSSEKENLRPLSDQLKELSTQSGILTIADTEGFLELGGMINFAPVKKSGAIKVDFEINRAAADQAGIRIQTALLKLARKVRS